MGIFDYIRAAMSEPAGIDRELADSLNQERRDQDEFFDNLQKVVAVACLSQENGILEVDREALEELPLNFSIHMWESDRGRALCVGVKG